MHIHTYTHIYTHTHTPYTHTHPPTHTHTHTHTPHSHKQAKVRIMPTSNVKAPNTERRKVSLHSLCSSAQRRLRHPVKRFKQGLTTTNKMQKIFNVKPTISGRQRAADSSVMSNAKCRLYVVFRRTEQNQQQLEPSREVFSQTRLHQTKLRSFNPPHKEQSSLQYQ